MVEMRKFSKSSLLGGPTASFPATKACKVGTGFPRPQTESGLSVPRVLLASLPTLALGILGLWHPECCVFVFP